MRNKLIAIVVSVALATGLLPGFAFAAGGSQLATADAPIGERHAAAEMSAQSSSGKYLVSLGQGSVVKAGGASFQLSDTYVDGRYSNELVMTKRGRSTTLATGVAASFATNGRYIFYALELSRVSSWESKCALYRHDVKTGKRVRLTTGIELTVCGCSGRYVYYGRNRAADGIDLRACDVKKRKSRRMVNGVGTVVCKSGRVITVGNHGDLSNVPIHSFKANGKGKVKVANGIAAVVKGKALYYTVFSYDRMKYKTYRCTLTGKHKKAVTGWRTTFAKKYGGW